MPQFSSPRSALAAAFKLARLAAATAILALGGQAHAKEFQTVRKLVDVDGRDD